MNAPANSEPPVGGWSGGRVTQHAWCVVGDNPSPLTLEGTNTWVYAQPGGYEAVVVDPGPASTAHLNTVLGLCRALEVHVAAIVLTHHHDDHAGGARLLSERTGAPIWPPAVGGRRDRETTVVVRRLRLLLVPLPGHTGDSLGVLCPVDHSIATGDTIFAHGSAMIDWPDGSLGSYFETLDRLRSIVVELKIDRILPGHGAPIDAPVAQIDRYTAHRRHRLAQVRGVLAAAGQPDADDLTERVYPGLDPELREAAHRTLQAQVQYIVEQAGGDG